MCPAGTTLTLMCVYARGISDLLLQTKNNNNNKDDKFLFFFVGIINYCIISIVLIGDVFFFCSYDVASAIISVM